MMPHAIDVLNQAFRSQGQYDQLKTVLHNGVTMTARGFLNDKLSAYSASSPEKVIALFREVVAPSGIIVSKVLAVIQQNKKQEWALNVQFIRNGEHGQSPFTISVICTLAYDLIGNIELKIEPSTVVFTPF